MLHTLSVPTLLSVGVNAHGLFITEAEVRDDGPILMVNIPKDARIAADQPARWELSKPGNSLWRWSAGGALMILKLRDAQVAVLSVSDLNLPVWASHLTAATGFAQSSEDWVRPMRLMREAFRSLAVATPTGLMVPVFGDPELDTLAFGAMPALLALIEREEELPSIFNTGTFNTVSAKMLRLKNESEIIVSIEGHECVRTTALTVLDQQTRGIDLMHAFEVDLGTCLLSEISVLHSKESNGRARNAEVCLVEIDSGKLVGTPRSFSSGKRAQGLADVSKLAPVLRETLAGL